MTRWRIVLAFGLAFIPAGVGAQSHFNTAGLGLVQEALDARTRALGGIGVGLMGSGLLPSDPASIGRLGIPTAVFTAQPSWTDYRRSDGADAGTVQGTRFPLVGVAYPVRQWGIGYLTFGSVFDQRFQAERPGSVVLGLDTVNVVDSLHADGGVSQIRVGFARPFGKYLSAGVSVARYNGSALRRFTRTFADGEVDPSVQDFATGGLWRYSGTSVTMGAGAQMGTVFRAA
ncbi:MAG: hypothetical protein OEZ37_02240, partial [Gemmatimonadota bacterium]|nr:hypothetical protein [Gemmatimonadota bacterium]